MGDGGYAERKESKVTEGRTPFVIYGTMRKVGRSQRRLSFVVSGLETMPVFFFFFFFSPIPSLCLASPRRHRRRRRRSVGPIICLMAVSRTNRSHRQKRGGDTCGRREGPILPAVDRELMNENRWRETRRHRRSQ